MHREAIDSDAVGSDLDVEPVSRPVAPVPEASSAGVRAVMRGNRGRDTGPEVRIRSALHRMGLRFRKHQRPLDGLRCEADIVFPRERVAVFVDGCFWHGCPVHGRVPKGNGDYWSEKLWRNRRRDRRNDVALHAMGWLVIRVWEHEGTDEVATRVWEEVVSRRDSS